MLYLSRKVGQSIIINENIEVQVMEVKGKTVKLGFEFPSDATILRKEIRDGISEENRSATVNMDIDFDIGAAISNLAEQGLDDVTKD